MADDDEKLDRIDREDVVVQLTMLVSVTLRAAAMSRRKFEGC